ncbi:MAG: hypothetical protein QF718_09235 [Phycisphaerales bacterium]|jgi:hypothetical protein|nr:hypothetical protein [Phycisphaerales bacterium]
MTRRSFEINPTIVFVVLILVIVPSAFTQVENFQRDFDRPKR